ncbi:MAG: hypothetical protein O3C06_03055 [Bacteroidetes bacterium]|nr:hypothetical protein [Bacteroidota bacterium]
MKKSEIEWLELLIDTLPSDKVMDWIELLLWGLNTIGRGHLKW